jgi:alpha/beta superfamily hydrolase
VEHQNLLTSDGHSLEADLMSADHGEGQSALGALVICHPHPLYGGNRHSIVVDTVFRTAPALGYHTLRFDFRSEHDHGRGETLDVIAAIDVLAGRHPDLKIHLIGYSFGAMVALTTEDPRVTSIVAIAPPLGLSAEPVRAPESPVLILSPAHDQFCTPEQAAGVTVNWRHCEVRPIPMADHSVSGQTSSLMPVIAKWLSRIDEPD